MIFGTFERMVAFRYLRARRQEGFISVIAGFSLLGIALGVATLIIVMSVMNGFRIEFVSRLLGLSGPLGVYGVNGSLPGFDVLADEIRKVQGVTSVTPLIEGQVLASTEGHAVAALVHGVRVTDLKATPAIANGIRAGSLDQLDNDSVMIGDRLALSLNVRLGDQITLISPQGNVTPFGTMPRSKTYRIAAIFNVGMYQYDGNYIFMSLPAAQVFFKVPNSVTTLEIFVTDPDVLGPPGRAIAKIVGDKGRVFDWKQSWSSYVNAIAIERNVMFLILTLIIIVAAFNIVSSMIMLVKDKGRDIAILRTMGATQGMILRIFFLSGASVGVLGTVLGFGLGMAFTLNIESIRQALQSLTGTNLFNAEIYFLSQLPAKIDPWEVGTVVSMAFGLSFLATIYPSWRAARLDPVEALRYE
jgi:lipoprotein-releasing system permease protein